jgi:geranylgeranyl diphosphate synthase type II
MNKTAALIRASVRTGALLANADRDTVERLSDYGTRIGLAFQVVDDILDEEGTTDQLGKDAGSDRNRGKATFPAVIGIEQSKQYAATLISEACESVRPFGSNAAMLIKLADFIRTRIF